MKYKLRTKITLVLAIIVMIIFGVVKTSVLIDGNSTSLTRWTEFICFISFIPLFSILIKDILSLTRSSISKESADKMFELENFLDSSAIISKADKKGKITYVNQKFTDVSGYTLDEVIGKDHNIVNSGYHTKDFWTNMYKVVVKDKDIWNGVCTNKTKNGELYYVDTFIKATFDSDGNLESFMSIRQDVTDLKIKEIEIENRMNAINKSNIVVEFDLDGNIISANDLFLSSMGYDNLDEVIGKNRSILMFDGYELTEDYINFWKDISNGNFFSGIVERKRKNGDLIYLQSTYSPIFNSKNEVYRIMKIATDVTLSVNQKLEIEKQNSYLEHAAKILRHDMHSGINTYIPRGISSLERRMDIDKQKEAKIDTPIKMIKEGLRHTQKVYKGVYEFTNLVKKDVELNKSVYNLSHILEDYLSSTAYRPQVIFDDLGEYDVNEALFCTALDNLIRNGLKYNDSSKKEIHISREDNTIYIVDNGRGMSSKDFKELSKPYTRKEGQKESGTGLGLNICIAILHEHGFTIDCEKLPELGTKIKIKLK